MRQEGKGSKGMEDLADLRSKMKVKKEVEREKTPKAKVSLDHLEEEEERRSKREKTEKKKKSKKKKEKNEKKKKSKKKVDTIKLLSLLGQSNDSDTESSSTESMDSDMAEDMLNKIKILQRENQRRNKRRKQKKEKYSRSSSSSSEDEADRKRSKVKKKKKKKGKEKEKNKKRKKEKKNRSTSNSDSDSVSSSEGSSDSEEEDASQQEIAKRRKELMAKKNQIEAVELHGEKTAKVIALPQVTKSKWERSEEEEEDRVPAKKPKIHSMQLPTRPTKKSMEKKSNQDSNDDNVVIENDKEPKQPEKKVPVSEIVAKKVKSEKRNSPVESVTEGSSNRRRELPENEKESKSVQEVRSIRYRSKSNSEVASKYRSRSKSNSRPMSRLRSTSGLSSPSLSRSPSRSYKEYKEVRRIRYESRSRSRSRQYRPRSRSKYYRSRSRSRRYKSRSRSGKYRSRSRSRKYRSRSRSRHYRSKSRYRIRSRSRPRSRSRSRYRRSRSRSYKRRAWNKELSTADRRSPPRPMSLQERLDSAANKRRREQEQASSSFTCGVKGSEEALKGREEARREFQAQLDQIIVSHTSSGGQGEVPPVPRICGECGEVGHPVVECPDSEANGTNPLGKDGKKQKCKHCGSYSHLDHASCPHSEWRGRNPVNSSGVKLSCSYCRSYDHMITGCRKIHTERLGRNPVGASGHKVSCERCGSFDHLASACKFQDVQDSAQVEDVVPIVLKPGRTPIVFDVKEAQERRLVGESLSSVRERLRQVIHRGIVPSSATPFEEGFCLMEKEESQNPCFWCKSNIHGSNTCPLRHTREYGVNPMNEYGVMQDCEQCGSYNHMIDICSHSEENGKNMVCQDGKKLVCYICGSFDHMLECKEKDNERNGRNKLDEEGTKPRCSHCGSWDHLPRACTHTYFAGRNRTICGKKERCPFCGSFGHIGELDCAKQSDIVREFLRLQIGAEKIRPRVKKIGKFEDFSHIANSKTIVRDTLSKEEKMEQKDAEKKLKERLMAKFGIKGTKEEEKAASPKPPEAQVAVFEEEVGEGDYYSPDEPDPSVFDGKDLRTAALAGYKQITEQMHNCVIDCLRGERDDVVCNFNITMTKKDLYCLTGENWLNDKALEFYLQMVASRRCQESQFRGGRLPRVHCMSTYFFLNLIMRGYEGSIQRWNKDVDIFTFHMVLVPIHLQEHWCLAIIDFRNKALLYYDPMGGENMPALSALLNYIGREHMFKKGRPIDLKIWAKEMVKDWPEQENTADCGMFVVKAAEFFSRDAPVKFSQEDMPYFRKRMIWEIINSTLVSP